LELKSFLINLETFTIFFNKIENCKIIFKDKNLKNKILQYESDYSEKNKIEESIELYKCCICFEQTNDIILDCGVI